MIISLDSIRPSVESLVRRGYLHDHAIPPLTMESLADQLRNLPTDAADPYWSTPERSSRCVTHSVPKRLHSRRILSIPNPQHQIPLFLKIVEHWFEIDAHCRRSRLSLSTPEVRPDSGRAVDRRAYSRDVSAERILRSVGARIHLYTDFTRFYGSLYTHSIAWALHGKDAARADERTGELAGNQLDRFVRPTQDRQSVGIPVGPDSSLILAEIIGSAIDSAIEAAGVTRGLRYVDDYHLYLSSRTAADEAIAALVAACRQYELEINDSKTLVEEMPDVCEPEWKIALRTFPWDSSQKAATNLKGFFNLAFALSLKHPYDSVLKYAVSRSGESENGRGDWQLYEALLCRSMLVEPSCLPDVFKIYRENPFSVLLDQEKLSNTLGEICRHNAPLQHGYEVAWALWFAVSFRCRISDEIAAFISKVEDDTVALVSMHAHQLGLMNPQPRLVWESWLTKEELNRQHWLAAYEMSAQRWLASSAGDYIAQHPFFRNLRDLGVRFYNASPPPEAIPLEDAVPFSEPDSGH